MIDFRDIGDTKEGEREGAGVQLHGDEDGP